MGFDSHKFFVYFFAIFLTIPLLSYAQQYYDPVTRRYIQKQPVTNRSIPVQRKSSFPTQAEIQAERERLQRERIAEEQRLEQIRNSSATRARRKFDPNRYHRTEDITIAPF